MKPWEPSVFSRTFSCSSSGSQQTYPFESKFQASIHNNTIKYTQDSLVLFICRRSFIAELVYQTQTASLQRELHCRDCLQRLFLELHSVLCLCFPRSSCRTAGALQRKCKLEEDSWFTWLSEEERREGETGIFFLSISLT